jgi:hypothetical protein
MSSTPHDETTNDPVHASSSPHEETNDQTVQDVSTLTLKQRIVATFRSFPSPPLGLRLLPIIFLCNFLEITQAQIVILAGEWWTLCIPWSVSRNTWRCTKYGGGVTLAVIIQYGWPITGMSISYLADLSLTDAFL